LAKCFGRLAEVMTKIITVSGRSKHNASGRDGVRRSP
jgi:hypothetical protein